MKNLKLQEEPAEQHGTEDLNRPGVHIPMHQQLKRGRSYIITKRKELHEIETHTPLAQKIIKNRMWGGRRGLGINPALNLKFKPDQG